MDNIEISYVNIIPNIIASNIFVIDILNTIVIKILLDKNVDGY